MAKIVENRKCYVVDREEKTKTNLDMIAMEISQNRIGRLMR